MRQFYVQYKSLIVLTAPCLKSEHVSSMPILLAHDLRSCVGLASGMDPSKVGMHL